MKTKNPFKLFGSWLGLLVSLPLVYFSFAIVLYAAEIGKYVLPSLFLPLAIAIAGFLIGWRVHLLIKK
jgi:hypothetical protein